MRLRFDVEDIVLHLGHDADDGEHVRGLRFARLNQDLPADRIGLAEHLPLELAIHDGRSGRRPRLFLGACERTAAQHVHA